jgi:hypothetical protein
MKQFPYKLSTAKWHSRIKLPFLISPKLRIAEISAIPTVELARGFPCGKWSELANYRPGVLVGTRSELQLLVEEIQRSHLDLSCVDRAIIVLTYSCSGLLDDVFRVALWQTFGVPVYELLLGPNSTLIAAECEAHEGWHVQPEAEIFFNGDEITCMFHSHAPVHTGWTGRLESETCACGSSSTRLMDLTRIVHSTRRRLAATA